MLEIKGYDSISETKSRVYFKLKSGKEIEIVLILR